MAAASNEHGKSGSRTGAPSGRLAVLTFLTLGMLSGMLLTACQPGGDTGSGPSGFGGQGGGGGSGGGEACTDGDVQECHITIGQHGNVLSCFNGKQTCAGGTWGPCDGTQSDKPPPPPATPCVNNPCDPTCQSFAETPATPIGSPPQNLIAPWQTGNFGSLPPALQALVNGEPCADGGACQMDQYCANPVTVACTHNKCVPGGGLRADCDPCVTQVCLSNSGCCTTPVPANAGQAGSCSHDLCSTGVALVKGAGTCDPCVNSVCSSAQWNFCCDTVNGAWTAECVDRVTTQCGKNCASGNWDSSCIGAVDTFCNAKCLADTTAPICSHDKCYLGDALDASCDPCVASICAQYPSCCTGGASPTWSGQCLDAVASVCGLTCAPKGDCVPWLPSETDPKCGGTFDLTVGVGCTSGAVKRVPVCNHGLAASPANLPLTVLPAAPPKLMPSPSPSLTGATTLTIGAVPAGKCINVDLPAGTAEGAQIVVNASNVAGSNSAECHNSNNWGVWSGATGACAEPSCAGASAFGKLKKIKLFFTVDVSLSMAASIVDPSKNEEPARWTYLQSALGGFMSSAPDDTAVWMRFWPNQDAVAGDCTPTVASIAFFGCSPQATPTTGCIKANVDVPDLTAANETAVINKINTTTLAGNTPMFPALDGATQAAIAFQKANPDWTAVVVLVTDGQPLGCITSVPKIAGLAGAAFNGYGVRTYAIGIINVLPTTIQSIAGAGGGKSFFINTNNAGQFQSQLVSALSQIKQDFVSCTLPLPTLNVFDPTKAVITYTPGAGAASVLPEVANAAACAGAGWYYDVPANPTSITLCPTTCSDVKLDSNGKLELKIDCVKQFLPSSTSETYEATCPKGTVVQWGFLAYDTTTPGDSSMTFRVQTSDDNVTFGALSNVLATAKAAPNTQVCAMGGPSPCPIDLFNGLGGLPAAQEKYLRLQADLTPTTDKYKTPTLNNWQVTYSCPDSE